MFCSRCGNRLPPNSRFCTRCGAPLGRRTMSRPAAPMRRPQAPVRQPQSPVLRPAPRPQSPIVPAQPVGPVRPPVSPVQPPQPKVVPVPLKQPVQKKVDETQKKPKKKSKLRWWITLGVVGIAALVLILFLVWPSRGDGSSTTTNTLSEEPVEDGSMTIMIYIIGSDLESEGGYASEDLIEIMNSSIDTDKHNVLVYIGGSFNWQLEGISPRRNETFILQDGSLVKLKSDRSSDMAASRTLQDFLVYSTQNYPAEKYGLVLWSHGGGPLVGYGLDEKTHNTMSIREIKKALENTGFGPDSKLELLGFDACLMSSLEVSLLMSSCVEFVVASQDNEPGWGWDYSWLDTVNDTNSGKKLGMSIVNKFMAASEKYDTEDSYSLTLSCVDLSYADEVEESLNALFLRVNQDLKNGNFNFIYRIREKAMSFGSSSDPSSSFDLVDLVHLTQLLSDTYEDETAQLLADLDKLIYYEKGNVENANGISIYHPFENRYATKLFVAIFTNYEFAQDYADYINNFGYYLTE